MLAHKSYSASMSKLCAFNDLYRSKTEWDTIAG